MSGLWPALKALGVRPPGSGELDVSIREHKPPVTQVRLSALRLAELLGMLAPAAAEPWFARLRTATAESLTYERGAPGGDDGPPAGTGQAAPSAPRAHAPARRQPRRRDSGWER